MFVVHFRSSGTFKVCKLAEQLTSMCPPKDVLLPIIWFCVKPLCDMCVTCVCDMCVCVCVCDMCVTYVCDVCV